MAIVIAIIIAFIIAGTLGSKRKIGFGWSLAACLLLSPIIGLIITLCSEKISDEENVETGAEEKPLAEVLTESTTGASEPADEQSTQGETSKEEVRVEESSKIDY